MMVIPDFKILIEALQKEMERINGIPASYMTDNIPCEQLTKQTGTTMNSKEFFILVSKMRDKQREYFRTRKQRALQESKFFENQVDAEIKRVNEILGNKQPSLFDGK